MAEEKKKPAKKQTKKVPEIVETELSLNELNKLAKENYNRLMDGVSTYSKRQRHPGRKV